MSLLLRFFAFDADEDPAGFALLEADVLDDAAAPAAPAESTNLVHLAVLSACDDDEDALSQLCQALEQDTGFDFSRAPRTAVAMDRLASFAENVSALHRSTEEPHPVGWLAALHRSVAICAAGYAHLCWELRWDQAGVTDGPDEQPTAAVVAPEAEAAAAIATFFGLTGSADGR